MYKVIRDLIEQRHIGDLKAVFQTMNAVDIAEALEELKSADLLMAFRLLPKELAAEVFSHITSIQQRHIIERITDKEIGNIIDELFIDDTVELIEEMPSNVVKRVLNNTDPDMRQVINQLLKYPEDSAGSIMTIEYVDLKNEMTVSQALDYIRETGVNKETVNISYVMDESRKLEGIVSLRKLVINDESVPVKDIMDTNIISISTHADQEEVAHLFKKYDFIAMPVVDKENRLVGIITVDDIVDIIEQESTEDFQLMAGIQPSEQDYLSTSVFTLSKNRFAWLLFLMISATLTGMVIKRYENILETVMVLAAFIPMLMDTGGNAGSQSATIIIRSLALGELKRNDLGLILWKEFRISLVVGFVLGLLNFVRLYYLDSVHLAIALSISITLVLTVIMAKVIGGALPIVARALKMDPAIMASPMITTIVDTLSLIAYFMIASALIGF
ncbi:MAG TPA: magnesium transporter [Bacillota bacterium]|nr:magnesium transporter [Bacillota bacterium]